MSNSLAPDSLEILADCLRDALGTTCLPIEYDTFYDLATDIVVRLAGRLVVVPKAEYDEIIKTRAVIAELRQLFDIPQPKK